MKQFSLRFPTLLLTFTLGICATWFCLQFSQFTLIDASRSDISLIWRGPKSFVMFALPTTKLKNSVKVSFVRSGTDENGQFIELRAENMSWKAVYFYGYDINHPCSYKVQSEQGQERTNNCTCPIGIERHMLLTGESTVYRIKPPLDAKKVKVGFDFSIKSRQPLQTFWSGEITLSK